MEKKNNADREKKIDKRIKYTKLLFKEALLKLMKEKPIDGISTSELCRTAELNRNTFYSHFSTVRDVLDMVEEEIEANILSSLSFNEEPRYMITKILKIISEHKEVFSVLFSSHGDVRFAKKLFDKMEKKTLQDFQSKNIQLDNKYLHYMFSYLFLGSLAIVQCWLSDDTKQNPEDISGFILNLANNGVSFYIK